MTSITPVAALAATTSAQNNAAANALGSSSQPSESMFLQLLVAQLKNQDPSTPQDPTAFVTELAQFSQVEQDVTIANNTTSIAHDLTPPATAITPAASGATTPAGN